MYNAFTIIVLLYRRFNLNDTWFQYGRKQGLHYESLPKLVAPEISLGGNFSYDKNGQYYSTTKIYGYIKRTNCPLSYEFLLALLNSSLFWFFIKNTGYVLRGGYFTFKTNYITPFPIPAYHDIDSADMKMVESLVSKILSKRKVYNACDISEEMKQIDIIICKIYNIDSNDVIY